MDSERVIIPYQERKQFWGYHDTDKRWRIIVAHRRAGKTIATVNEQIRSALTCRHKDPRTAYIAPLYKQAKDVAWSYAKEFGLAVPGAQANESELRIDFPNGGRFRLYGADNPDAMRGIYLDDCVLDEYADMRPRFMPEVIRPALSDRRGKLTIIGTPKGHNEFYDTYEKAKGDEEWFHLMLKASETNLIAPDELASAQRLMSASQYDQEYECSFEAAIEGAFYGTLMSHAEADGRITTVPYEGSALVTTAWDLGADDSTAIWFAQIVGLQVRILDYYENNGQPLAHYASIIKGKPYNYGDHILPHDAGHERLGKERNESMSDQLRTLGLPNRVLPIGDREAGIEKVRQFIPKCWFDKVKCQRGLEALRQYRREYDDKRKTFRSEPLHDWASDGADAFRYLATGIKEITKYKPIEYPDKGRGIV